MYRETPQKDLVRYNQPKLPFLCSWFGHKATTNGFFTTYLMNVYDYDYNKTINKVLGFSTVCEKCGINFIQPVNFSDVFKCKNYFDQHYYEYRLKRMYFVHYMNFNSFEQINEFIEKNNLSRKRKWWEKYEWNSFVIKEAKQKFVICSKTFQMMKIK